MNPLFAVLPALFAVLCFVAWRRLARSRLDSVLLAAICLAVAVVALTEALGLLELLTAPVLLIAWLAADAVLAGWLWRRRPAASPASQEDAPAWWLGAVLAAPILLTLAVALLATPNNWDSMTYHLSRVEHWLQNRSLEFYPTSIPRQLQLGPLAEMAILQWRALCGSNAYANLVQWSAFAGCMAAAASVCRRLGGGGAAQALAAVFVATLPMAILQASSTQNDLVAALFVLCTVDRAIALHAGGYRHGDAVLLGAAAGAAVLTKGTAYIYLCPVALALGAVNLRSMTAQKALAASLVVAVVLAMNLGHFWRNLRAFREPLGTQPHTLIDYRSPLQIPGYLASSVVRNVASELLGPIGDLNQAVASAARSLHSGLGIDVNDRATTWGQETFRLEGSAYHEDFAGNPLHAVLAAAALVFCAWRLRHRREVLVYGAAVTGGLLLFAALLRWQPWITRLHMPGLALLAPIAGIALEAAGRAWYRGAAVVLALASIPWLLFNQSRPLVPREAAGGATIVGAPAAGVMFVGNPAVLADYQLVTSWLSLQQATRIGLRLGENSWEYPFWWMLERKSMPPVRIEHFCLAAAPAFKTAPRAFSPQFVVATDVPLPPQIDCGGVAYAMVAQVRSVAVYAPPQPK